MICITDARPNHIASLSRRLRAIDVLECCALGYTPKAAMRTALAGSAMAWTARVDGRVEAMFGVTAVSTLAGIGSPWFLGTDEVPRHARALVELASGYIADIQAVFPRLENQVHRDNTAAIRWLTRLGFQVEAETSMVGGEPMRRFVKG